MDKTQWGRGISKEKGYIGPWVTLEMRSLE